MFSPGRTTETALAEVPSRHASARRRYGLAGNALGALPVIERVEHFDRRNVLLDLPKFRVVDIKADRPRDPVDHAGKFGQLMLGEQADMKIEIGAPFGRSRHAVLADQDEGGQEDRL